MSDADLKEKLPLMPGTSSNAYYVKVAQRGNVALGIRAYLPVNGDEFGASGYTYLRFRVHETKVKKDGTENHDNGVTSLVKQTVGQTFPISWENVNSIRAATTLGYVLDVSMDDPDRIVNRLNNGLAHHLAEAILGYAHEEDRLITTRLLRQYIDATITKHFARSAKNKEAVRKSAEQAKKKVNILDVQTNILSGFYEAAKSSEGDVEQEYGSVDNLVAFPTKDQEGPDTD